MATNAVYGVATYGSSQYGTLFVTGGTGSYTLTGGSATLLYGRNVTAAVGSYALTGQDAQTLATRTMAGAAGDYAVTGFSSALIHNDVIYAGYWQFNITGYDAGLTATRLLSADAGAYTLTGSDADLLKTSLLSSSAGSFSITGFDAVLSYQPNQAVQTTGGIDKKVKTKVKKSQRDEVEAAVREAFDKMDGTYVPPKLVKEIQKETKREIKQIDLTQYDVAMAQVNALLLQAQLRIHEYEAEIDDEESLLMLL